MYNLPKPFDSAFENGASIDYKLVPDKISDSSYVESLGHKTQMSSDCSIYSDTLPGLALASYGNWGTICVSLASDEVKRIFLQMCEEGIIEPWRISIYLCKDGNVVHYSYRNGGWIYFNSLLLTWDNCKSPFEE